MGFVNDLFAKLFSKENTDENTKAYRPPYLTESLVRSEQFNEKKSNPDQLNYLIRSLQELREKYSIKKGGLDEITDVVVMDNPYAAGVALNFHNESKAGSQYLLDFIANGVKKQGYVLQNANRRIFDGEGQIKEIERYYLKPHLRSTDFTPPVSQLFGNVLLELELRNNEPRQLRWSCNYYKSRDYQEPLPFEELVDSVISVNN